LKSAWPETKRRKEPEVIIEAYKRAKELLATETRSVTDHLPVHINSQELTLYLDRDHSSPCEVDDDRWVLCLALDALEKAPTYPCPRSEGLFESLLEHPSV